jgi:hypothetical protein
VIPIGPRQAKLFRRTHHALRVDTAQFRFLDHHPVGQGYAGQRQRHLVTDLVVLRAANNLAFTVAVIDAAHGESLGIWMFVAGKNLTHNDLLEHASPGGNHIFHFNPCKRQLVGQFTRRPIHINVLFQPVVGEFHASNECSLLLGERPAYP